MLPFIYNGGTVKAVLYKHDAKGLIPLVRTDWI